MRKKVWSKTVAWFLTAAMVTTMMPVMAESVQAEWVSGEKETDYASESVEPLLLETPKVKQINFGADGISDPAVPDSTDDAWAGSYVHFGNYDADGDKAAEPLKYRVLDASTTDYSADGTTKTMLLDCNNILYKQDFDGDGVANEGCKNPNEWAGSDVKISLNGKDFLEKDGVFTAVEKNAIAASTKKEVNASDGAGWGSLNYAALTGEKIFLLDAKEVTRLTYGFSNTSNNATNRLKDASSQITTWWLRSASRDFSRVGCVTTDGYLIRQGVVNYTTVGVSPALNLDLSSVLFTSVSRNEPGFADKSSSLTTGSAVLGTTTDTEWKLTLLDTEKKVTLTGDRVVTKADDGTITVPYTYTDKAGASDSEKVNQISVMITDKEYKTGNADGAEILYYGALDNIENAEGKASTVANAATGTGTFALPSGLAGKIQGTDYHLYLLAEHVNADDSTDYAGEPLEIEVKTSADTIAVPDVSGYAPIAEQPLKTEMTIASEVTSESAVLTWKKGGKNDAWVTGSAEWKTTYQMYVTLTAAKGYAFVDAKGNVCAKTVTLKGALVKAEDVSANADGTVTVYCGEYITATRRAQGVTAPETPKQFTNYYTAGDVLSSAELGTTAKVTLEGTAQPNPEEMEVDWSVVDAADTSAVYDPTPGKTNIFKWTVRVSEYADYNKGDVVLEGTVTIQNKEYTPVSISGSDEIVTYDGSDTLDISTYFTIDKNAGTTHYELVDTSTGTGTLNGKMLNMTELGTFVIRCSTDISGVYNKGEHTLTVTVKKAIPNVVQIPTVLDRVYHPAAVLKDADMTGGLVKDVAGVTLQGTWGWKKADVVAVVGNSGYVAVFTPDDTVHYDTVEKTISVNVSKVTPVVKTVPTATITYGNTLGAYELIGGVVCYSKKDETKIAGKFIWKNADQKPHLLDSNITEYDAVFTPTDEEDYNSVEIKLTITVKKAAAPSVKPSDTITVSYNTETVGAVKLPWGWMWTETDKTKPLAAGAATKAEAVYIGSDNGCYENVSVTVTITREQADSTGGSDSGITGDLEASTPAPDNTAKPGETPAPDNTTKPGETPAPDNTAKPGETPAPDNTTKPSETPVPDNTTKPGSKPAVGKTYQDDSGKAFYIVTSNGKNTGTVTYKKPADKNITTVTIPATVTINGVTYKVTAIEKNAFRGCKKLKTVIIGKNILKIGEKAFYGCKSLQTLNVQSVKLTKKNVGSKAFGKTPENMTVKLPKKKFKAYKKLLVKRGVSKNAKFQKKQR